MNKLCLMCIILIGLIFISGCDNIFGEIEEIEVNIKCNEIGSAGAMLGESVDSSISEICKDSCLKNIMKYSPDYRCSPTSLNLICSCIVTPERTEQIRLFEEKAKQEEERKEEERREKEMQDMINEGLAQEDCNNNCPNVCEDMYVEDFVNSSVLSVQFDGKRASGEPYEEAIFGCSCKCENGKEIVIGLYSGNKQSDDMIAKIVDEANKNLNLS